MKSKVQLKDLAVGLRRSGRSYGEIMNEVPVAKGTLSLWLRTIKLDQNQKNELERRTAGKVSRRKMNSAISIRAKRVFRDKKIYEEAEKEFAGLSKDPFFTMGIALYWKGGVKKGSSFQFSSSNLDMIYFMQKWIRKYLNIDNSAIKIRKYEKYSRVDISQINVLRKMIAWQKLIIKYYSEVSV